MTSKGRGGSNLYKMNGFETPETEFASLMVSSYGRAHTRKLHVVLKLKDLW